MASAIPHLAQPYAHNCHSNPRSRLSLVAIALNTMTQSSPYLNTLFSDPFSLFRASPIFCLADLFVMLLWPVKLTLFSSPKLSFLEAVRCFRKETGLEKKEERVSILTVVLFILGPLPQFVKLNACSGIRWTLTWSWIYMLCYVFTAMTIGCGRENGQDRNLLRSGTTLRNETKEFLKKASRWTYILAHISQAILSIWLIKISLYTYNIHALASEIVAILLWGVFNFVFLIPIMLGIRTFVPGQPGGLLRRLSGLFLAFFALRSYAFVILSPYFDQSLDIILDLRPVPFTPWSIVVWLMTITILPFSGFGLLHALSVWIGPNLEISFRGSHNRGSSSDAPIPPVIQSFRQPESSERLKDEALNAACQLLFAISFLVLALAYYWQLYDPSYTVKPG